MFSFEKSQMKKKMKKKTTAKTAMMTTATGTRSEWNNAREPRVADPI